MQAISVFPGNDADILVNYRYLWSGVKFSAQDPTGNGYQYVGRARYLRQRGSLSLESLPIPDGRLIREGAELSPRYFLTDHLGNVRTVTNAQKEILAEYDYLPYGTQHANATQPQTSNDYRYNGKEIQDRFGFGFYDYHARQMDAEGRFLSIDPKAKDYTGISPYLYCAGNPIRYIDPDGKDVYRYDDKTGKMKFFKQTDDDFDQIGKFKYDKKTGDYTLKTNKKGEAKTRMDKIEKGILSDDMNFETDDNVWDVGAPGQPTVEGFQDFAIGFGEMIHKEVSGYYLSRPETPLVVSNIYMGRHINNTLTESKTGLRLYNLRPELKGKIYMHTSWHTHPTYGYREADRTTASPQDRDAKKRALEDQFSLRPSYFIILTGGLPPIFY